MAQTDRVSVTAVTASAELGGTERVLLDLARYAGDERLDLRVLVPRVGPLLEALAEHGIPAEPVLAPERLLRASQQRGHLATLPQAVAGLWTWAQRLEAHRFFSPPTVAYTVGFKAHVAAALSLTRPRVWHLHEFPPGATAAVWRPLAGTIPDAVIVNSRAVGAAWRAEGGRFAPDPVVVHNGVDTEVFRPAPPTGWIHETLDIPPDHRLLGMPAVLARWKGQREVMDAFTTVADEHPDVHLVFVGGSIYDTTAEREYGDELRAAVGPARRVHILPFQRAIERVYPELYCAVHYSQRAEPFGRVILEAMACGVPVIAADEGGPPEILGATNGDPVGWLAPPRDVRSLAALLHRVLSAAADTHRAKGEAARRRAVDVFPAARFAAGVAEVCRATLRTG